MAKAGEAEEQHRPRSNIAQVEGSGTAPLTRVNVNFAP